MTWSETLTTEEREVVEELKRRTIKDCSPKMLQDDSVFFRFCKARDFNLKDAEEMLRKHLSWRNEYEIDTILTDYKPPEVIVKYSPITFLGFDKNGDVVKYIDFGRVDSKGMINSVKKIDIVKFNLLVNEQDLERLRQHSKEIGRPVGKIIFIYNLDQLTFAKATNKKVVDLMILAVNMYQDNYPEVIKHFFFLNASIYFTLLYSILKQFISPHLEEKIRVFGTDGYKDALLDVIDADVVPAFLGGNRTDPDGNPNCFTCVKWGEDVPQSYYRVKSERRLSICPGVTKLTVSRFAKTDIRFEVSKPGSLLEWEFETKCRDIGFGVYLKAGSNNPVELVPKQRIDTCMEPETGVYKCKKAGTYILVFDNSYSWIHPKDIFYRARIIEDPNTPWTESLSHLQKHISF